MRIGNTAYIIYSTQQSARASARAPSRAATAAQPTDGSPECCVLCWSAGLLLLFAGCSVAINLKVCVRCAREYDAGQDTTSTPQYTRKSQASAHAKLASTRAQASERTRCCCCAHANAENSFIKYTQHTDAHTAEKNE